MFKFDLICLDEYKNLKSFLMSGTLKWTDQRTEHTVLFRNNQIYVLKTYLKWLDAAVEVSLR